MFASVKLIYIVYIIFFICYNIEFYVYKEIYWSYLPNPSAQAGYDTRSIFKRSLTGLNSEFSF